MHRPTCLLALLLAGGICAFAQNSDNSNNNSKHFDVQSSVGDLHLGDDADARKVGVPLYPGAQLKADESDKDGDSGRANLSLLTEAFGFKLIVAKYGSPDPPDKIVAFYRNKLKKYGKVLECHSQKHAGDGIEVNNDDKDSSGSKQLKCDDNNSGPVTELKVGTEDRQRVVAVEPADSGKGTTFALVYVYTRGKQGDI